MKIPYYISFVLILFTVAINAFNVTISDRDMNNYLEVENIERNIKFNGERLLDVYYDKNTLKQKKHVVIHIFGSYWIKGDKIGQTKIGSLLEREGYVAVVPNYVLFPNGTVEDMVDDIYNAIQWTYKNISKYGGNPKKIYICAHSSGAHIAALTIIKSALNLENNGVKLEPLPKLRRVILLNGPYSFDAEFLTYTLQGSGNTSNVAITSNVEEQLLLQKLMMTYYNDKSISPIELLKECEKNSSKLNVNKFVFFYTADDNVIPESSSKGLISEIMRTSSSSFEYIYEEGLGHATVTDGVKAGLSEYEEWYMDLIHS
ncbi:alpha/beta-hydrolase [Piromyces finnis]|uniref:Alpha/beta-hydrolase n=1 Tax=Piromyces finnis TaxID=1754191 RepID=A0A1Y1VIM1_9FUNG|nr:alpha/beta-hydrolase [Piromyces finnis]|eukprot:ORX57265.1 alpha/beta-hydrolase [Piromyces finnis]